MHRNERHRPVTLRVVVENPVGRLVPVAKQQLSLDGAEFGSQVDGALNGSTSHYFLAKIGGRYVQGFYNSRCWMISVFCTIRVKKVDSTSSGSKLGNLLMVSFCSSGKKLGTATMATVESSMYLRTSS